MLGMWKSSKSLSWMLLYGSRYNFSIKKDIRNVQDTKVGALGLNAHVYVIDTEAFSVFAWKPCISTNGHNSLHVSESTQHLEQSEWSYAYFSEIFFLGQ